MDVSATTRMRARWSRIILVPHIVIAIVNHSARTYYNMRYIILLFLGKISFFFFRNFLYDGTCDSDTG